MNTPRHLLTLRDYSPAEAAQLLAQAKEYKRTRGRANQPRPLAGKSVAMIFSKSSTRTRVSFEVGIHELGGHALFLDGGALQLGRGESMGDTAQVFNRYVHAVVIRCHKHQDLEEFARSSTIPVINALTDSYHPCQALADLQTIEEHAGQLAGVKIAYLGDGASNVANSLCVGCRQLGLELRVAAPVGYQPNPALLASLKGPGTVQVTTDPRAAVDGAQFVYTDVWVSMGFEAEAKDRLTVFQPYQVNDALLAAATKDVKVLHCLPAYRGKEIAAEVLDSPRAIVWDQAENRLHAQKAILAFLLA